MDDEGRWWGVRDKSGPRQPLICQPAGSSFGGPGGLVLPLLRAPCLGLYLQVAKAAGRCTSLAAGPGKSQGSLTGRPCAAMRMASLASPITYCPESAFARW